MKSWCDEGQQNWSHGAVGSTRPDLASPYSTLTPEAPTSTSPSMSLSMPLSPTSSVSDGGQMWNKVDEARRYSPGEGPVDYISTGYVVTSPETEEYGSHNKTLEIISKGTIPLSLILSATRTNVTMWRVATFGKCVGSRILMNIPI